MNKLNFIRIFLKDTEGNHYRIFSVANPKDRKGEHYLKIVFPDIKNIPLITGKHNKRGVVTELDRLPRGISEFTYHYRSGISHFKDSRGYIDSKGNMQTLINYPALNLVRFIVRSIEMFEIQKESKINSDDFILPIPFDGKPRGFELALSRISGGWTVTNTQGNGHINTYKIGLEDQNVSFHIADGEWTRPPMAKGITDFEIFRYDDPIRNFQFKAV